MASLDVGYGMKKHKGCIGIDIRRLKGVDVVADVSMFPFKDNSFNEVILSHIVEHMADLVNFMKEVWRICKNHVVVHILTPHFTSYESYADLTHRPHLTCESFDYFEETTLLGKYLW